MKNVNIKDFLLLEHITAISMTKEPTRCVDLCPFVVGVPGACAFPSVVTAGDGARETMHPKRALSRSTNLSRAAGQWLAIRNRFAGPQKFNQPRVYPGPPSRETNSNQREDARSNCKPPVAPCSGSFTAALEASPRTDALLPPARSDASGCIQVFLTRVEFGVPYVMRSLIYG